MANTTGIHVTGCDNELHILASTAAGSYELCQLKSGYSDPVNYQFNPGHILPAGSYELTLVGINWGGPWKFDVALTPGGPTLSGSAPSGPVGVVWQKTVPITV